MRDDLVDVGGRRLHITCAGKRSPTIVLEAGMGDPLTTWASIWPALAEMTSVMSYDRAGLGQSDPTPLPRTLNDMVTDLDTLLSSAKIPGPYVLVGHSFGAQIIRLFAARHPLETKGMVLIDPSQEDKYAHFERVFSKQLIERQDAFLNDPSRNTEHINLLESKLQLNASDEFLNGALIVMSRGKPDKPSLIWPTQAVQEIELELQRELLAMPGSGLRRHIVAKHSGHYIHQDAPELVLSLIGEIIETVRVSN